MVNVCKKIYLGDGFKDFRNENAQNPKLPSIDHCIDARNKKKKKKNTSRSSENKNNKIFIAQRYKLNTHFGSNLI